MKKIILILVFVLVAGLAAAQESGEMHVKVVVHGGAIYKLIGKIYPDGYTVKKENEIKEFTVLSEKDEKFIVDMEGGKYVEINVDMLDYSSDSWVKIVITDYAGSASVAFARYDFNTGHMIK